MACPVPYNLPVSERLNLTAADGHGLEAWLFRPPGKPVGGLVMIQEIFGLTGQMKRCAASYAQAGYLTVLPAMFDRVRRDLVVDYGDFRTGGEAAMSIPPDQVLADVEAARQAVAEAGKTAIMGFCWGGTVAFMGASRQPFACGVSWYGGGIGKLLEGMQPKVPVQYHFGADDMFIPPATIERIRAADPGGEFHIYPGAGHGFNCDDRDGYQPDASRLATARSLSFLARHLGQD